MFNFLKRLLEFFKKKPIEEQRSTGALPSPADENDFALSSITPEIKRYPESCPAPFDLTILDQGSLPACVGFSLAVAKQFLELKEKIVKVFDGAWLYNECKKIDGLPNFPGTYLRTGLDVLKKTGAKPINESDPSPYKIQMYARNDENTFEGIKKAVYLFGFVWAGYTGSNPGWRSEIVRPPLAGETTWKHAVIVIGYEKDYLICQNSWGELAHSKGLFKIPANYLPFESWVIVVDAATGLVPQPIKTGWVAVNYIQEIGGVWKATANLNVRSDAGTGYPVLKTLPQGTTLQLTNAPRKSSNGMTWEQIII